MRITTRRLFGAATLLALSTTGLLGGTASATPAPVSPDPGDPRAVAVTGNVEWDHANACVKAGLTGTAMAGVPKKPTTPTLPNTTDGKRSITITGGLEGYTVTGVVVKGGNAYNVYTAEKLGELDWEDLRAPINSSGGAADISHWFFCAEKVAETPRQTTTTTAPSRTDSSTTTPSETTTPDETGSTTPDETDSVVPTTTTESIAVTPTSTTVPAVAAGANDDDLANTGFDGGWMLIVGLGLVAAGAAFVASPKLRGLLRR